MKEEELRKIIDEIDPEGKLSDEKVNELISSLTGTKGEVLLTDEKNQVLNDLKRQLVTESDWRTKASIAANIISLNLE